MASEIGSVATPVERLEQALIQKIEAGEVELPLLPQAARQVLALAADPASDAAKLSSIDSPGSLIDRAPYPLQFMDRELVEQFIKGFEQHGGRYLGGSISRRCGGTMLHMWSRRCVMERSSRVRKCWSPLGDRPTLKIWISPQQISWCPIKA